MTESQPSLRQTLSALVFARLMMNGARRFPYVILTPMAQSLGVPRSTLEGTLSILWAIGAIGPFSGALIDRVGPKRMMMFATAFLGVFALLAALAQNVTLVLIAIVAGGLAKIFYDPAMQAYIGDRTPYNKRGMAIGVTELSWSGSLFIFGPLAAFLIVNATLGAIYATLAVGSLLSLFFIYRIIQPDTQAHRDAKAQTSLRAGYRLIFSNPSAMTLLATALLLSVGIESIAIIYEEWLRTSFNMTTLTLGSLSWVIGIAEIVGEFFVIAVADRLGKRRLVVGAIITTGISYLLLSIFAVNPIPAVIGIFLLFLCFEISVVSFLPLATEAVPQVRGTMMSLIAAAFSAGRAMGTLTGGALFRMGGISYGSLFAMIISFVTAALVWRFVAEHRGEQFNPELLENLD